MKSSQIRKVVHLGIDPKQPINVRYVMRAPRQTGGRPVAGAKAAPQVDILLTAGQWRARYYEHRRTSRAKARRLRRADRRGVAAKR